MHTTAAATTAVRKTAKGEKVYIHTGCSCAKPTGRVLKHLETVADGQAHAAEHGLEAAFCKTSQEITQTPATVESEIILDNRDQYGAQRRGALAAILEATGGHIDSSTGIKNKNRTGNDAFQVRVTAPQGVHETVAAFFHRVENELDEIVADAKAEGKAQGWDSNTREKHWKNTARAYIVAEGARVAAELA